MIRILFVLLLCGLVACGAFPGAGDSLPDLSGEWSITLIQSGGIAGLQRTLTVTSEGQVTALEMRSDRSGSLQLSPGELVALEQLVAASSFVRPTRTDSGCADCFLYDLQIQSPAGSVGFQLDDVTLPDSGLQPLVAYLVDLMDQALAAP